MTLSGPGRAASVHLLVPPHLVHHARAAPPVLRGPGDRGVAGVGQLAVPGPEPLQPFGAPLEPGGETEAADLGGDVLVEPASELGPERLGLGRVGEVHRQSSSPPAARRASTSRVAGDILGVELFGGADVTVDFQLAHHVHLAEGVVEVRGAVVGRDEPAGRAHGEDLDEREPLPAGLATPAPGGPSSWCAPPRRR